MLNLPFINTDLTPKQREVLEQLLRFLYTNNYPPSIQQLCQLCGVSSTSTIHFHLSSLKKKGLIGWNPAEKRAISVREDLRDAYRSFVLEGEREEEDTDTSSRVEGRGVLPMLGAIAAGSPCKRFRIRLSGLI